MLALYPLTVWLHLIAAVVWIGGMIFLVAVVLPVLRRPEHRPSYAPLVRAVGRRFRWVGWACLILLVGTGFLQLSQIGFSPGEVLRGGAFRGRFGHVLAVKLTLVAIILGSSVLHDFWVGPRAGELARRDAGSPRARRYRRAATWIGRLNLLLALVVTLLGVSLLHGRW